MRLIVIALLTHSLTAYAADDKDEAKRHFEIAQKAQDAENYRLAAEEYEKSYQLFPSPGLLWNVAQAYRKFDQKKALHYYRLYLETVPPGTRAARYVNDAKRLAAELERVVGAEEKVKLSPPDGTVSHSDAENQPAATATQPSPSAPSTAAQATEPQPQSPPRQVLPSPTRDWYRTPLAITGFSLFGVALAATGVAVGLLVHGDDLDHQLANTTSIPQAESIANSRDSYRAGSYATFAIGGAAAVVGAVLVGIGARRGRSQQVAFSATPAVSGGIVLSVGGSL